MSRLRIGTAGWAIPRTVAERFPKEGSGLQRYATGFDAAEINSSFHRSHRPATYARWAAASPPGFKLAVKLPRAITHDARLADAGGLLEAFLAEAARLGDKLGPLLIQLPPSLAFDPLVAAAFVERLRSLFAGDVVCEPRHASWFEDEPDELLQTHTIARVAADPARHPLAGLPGGWRGLAYWRLHRSPAMYRSSYGADYLRDLAETLCADPAPEVWCIFDNTTLGAAAANAIDLAAMVNAKAR